MDYFVAALFAFSLVVPLFSFKLGLMLYLAGALLFPYLHIGNLFIRLELIYVPWLFLLIFLSRSMKRHSFWIPQIVISYILFLAVVIFSTFVAFLREQSGEVFPAVIVLYGLIRPLFILFIFSNVCLDVKFIRKTVWVFIVLGIPINLFSIIQFLGIDVVERVTKAFYISPSVQAPYENLMAIYGRLARPMSVFESPVYNANYALLVILVSLLMLQYAKNRQLRLLFYFTGSLATLAGILTLSSTFLLGFIVLVGMVFWSYLRSPKRLFRMAGNAAAVIMVAILLFNFSPFLKALARGGLNYQIERIVAFRFLQTRYDPEQGNFSETYRSIRENPILGRGAVREEKVFLGDSVYVTTIYMGGFLGLSIYIFMLFQILNRSHRRRFLPGDVGLLNLLVFYSTLLLLATGIGSPSFHIRRLSEWYWTLVGMSLNRNIMASGCHGRSQ